MQTSGHTSSVVLPTIVFNRMSTFHFPPIKRLSVLFHFQRSESPEKKKDKSSKKATRKSSSEQDEKDKKRKRKKSESKDGDRVLATLESSNAQK